MILGLPAVLIVMTSRKVVYVCWMLVYLLSLPIWNFVLPVYAYWHFDDFSWGDTRKVEGSDKKKEASGHGDKEGEFDSSKVTMKKWSHYEKDRRTQMAMERNLPMPRFLERPRSTLDLPSNGRYTNKPGSAGSSDSDTPLNQTSGDISDPTSQQQQRPSIRITPSSYYPPTNDRPIQVLQHEGSNTIASPATTPIPHMSQTTSRTDPEQRVITTENLVSDASQPT
jgi:chitin synthase